MTAIEICLARLARTVLLGIDPDGGFVELRDNVESPALFAGVLANGTGTGLTLDAEGNRVWTSP